MPARIVLVHDDPKFLDDAAQALKAAGHSIAAFPGSMEALSALEAARTIELLITRATFPPGTPNGLALARMARLKRPNIQVLFVAREEIRSHADGLGGFLPSPVDPEELVKAVDRILNPHG